MFQRVWILVVGMLALNVGLMAQQKTALSADQTLKSNARVNPSTLAMEMQIPLANYPGRGIDTPISLSYSSKVWRIRGTGMLSFNTSNVCYNTGIPMFSEETASGWESNVTTPYIEYTGKDNLFNERGYPAGVSGDPCSNDVYYYNAYVKRLLIHLPGGETHELRADDSVVSYLASSTNDPLMVWNQANWDTTYYAVDGSNIKYVEDSTQGTNGKYRLMMPDGKYMDFSPSTGTIYSANPRTVRKAETLKDLNGNTINYHDGYLTDTLGRTIPQPVGLQAPSSPTPTSSPTLYTIPGMGSSNITYKLHWKKLKDPTDTTGEESGLTNFSDTLCYVAPGYPLTGSEQPPSNACILFGNTFRIKVYAPVAEFNPIVLTKIELPNGLFYQFGYNPLGEITKVTYPTGGTETFVYDIIPALNPPDNTDTDINRLVNLGVSERRLKESDGADPALWSYSTGSDTAAPYGYKIRTVNPDGTKSERYLHRGNANCSGCDIGTFGYDTPLAGMPYEERSYTSGPDNLISKKITSWTTTSFTVLPNISVPVSAEWHPRVTNEETIVYDTSTQALLSSSTTTDYDTITARANPLRPTTVNTYDFTTTLHGQGNLLKSVETSYLDDASHAAVNLRTLPNVVQVKDSAGSVPPKAKTQFVYDECDYELSSSGSMPNEAAGSWTTPLTQCGSASIAIRGRVTSVKSYHDISNSLFIETHSFYDQYGNVRKVRDGRGNDRVTVYSADNAFAYPTSVVTAAPDPNNTGHGSTSGFTTSTIYNYNTGLPTSTMDLNGQTTLMDYTDPVTSQPDPLLRIHKVTAPNGQQTISEYGAGTSPTTRWVKIKSQIDETNWKVGYQWFDGLGRTIRTQKVDTSGDVFALVCYDSMGRTSKTTNPFRGYVSGDCNNIPSGLEWSTNEFDPAGRPWKVTTPDTAVVLTSYGLATSGSRIGNSVTVTDQALKHNRSITNALGQLTRVDEPDPDPDRLSDPLGAVSTPNQPTFYTYDVLNNLTGVQQDGNTSVQCTGKTGASQTSCAQARNFVYDSVSRLKSADNPESGTILYTYDSNNNLQTKTDARNITTTYSYDALNRVTHRDYSDSTKPVDYTYDNITNAKGKLIKVTSDVSTTEYTSFDILGRVTEHRQTTAGGDPTGYRTGYTYKLGNALDEETYPSGRVVKSVLDNNGELAALKSKKVPASPYVNYASNFTYNPAGALTSMELGNLNWESTVFNSRMQPTQIALGRAHDASDLLRLDYSYGTTENNGNVLAQDITITRTGLSPMIFNQTYSYDSLNRLNGAEEKMGTITNWKQTFTFDRYGNRNFDRGNTSQPSSFAYPNIADPTVNPANNKFAAGQGWTYDPAGNLTIDGNGNTFSFDAENKQVEAKNPASTTLGTYYFDGDGKRVKKVVPSGETTIFVYDAAGKSIAEYSTTPASTPQVQYLTNDHLGTPRINTVVSGAIISRHDYMPFGEEIVNSQARTPLVGYNEDTIRKQFTGYELDGETGLDFAQGRNYLNSLGRFAGADDFFNDFSPLNPQTTNKYSYVHNTPLTMVDPDGRKGEVIVQVDARTKRISVTFKTSIGFWGQKQNVNNAASLAAIQKNVTTQLKKWAADNVSTAGGYKIDYHTDITVKTFQNANNYDDVLRQDNTIQNVIRIVDGPTQDNPSSGCGGDSNSCMHGNAEGGSKASINNPDGTKPDTGTWRFSNAANSIEPAHEFIHIMGMSHPAWGVGGPSYDPYKGVSAQNTQVMSPTQADRGWLSDAAVNRGIQQASFGNATHLGNGGYATVVERRRIASN
jgi:RHS repeat-associated protein